MGRGEPPVAFLLNKIKYLETEWKTPRAALLLSEYSLQKLKNTTLMQKKKQTNKSPNQPVKPKRAPGSTFNPLARALAGMVNPKHLSSLNGLKPLPAMRETWVQSPGQEDPLEKKMAIHSVFLPGESYGRRSLVG